MNAAPAPHPWFQAWRLSIPVACAFLPVGVAFGVYALQLGLAWPVVLCLSVFVYAGSSEFLAASMLAAHAPWASVALAGFGVNFRHVFYGLSVAHALPERGWARRYTLATLSDETYAILAAQEPGQAAVKVRLAFLHHVYWVVSVTLGVFLGSRVGHAFDGVEFCLPALFAVLCVEQWREARAPLSLLLGGVGALALAAAAPEALLLGGVAGSALILTACATWRASRPA